MEIRAREFHIACCDCGAVIRDGYELHFCGDVFELCLDCLLRLGDLCHEATCEKDVTGKCDCWKGER